MKKVNKFIPLLASLLVLASCTKTPKIQDKKNTIVEEDPAIIQDTYQDIYDDFYAANGVKVAVDELLIQVAKKVLTDSDNWKTQGIQEALAKKVEKLFDDFYKNESYKENHLFKEEKLANALRTQGYTITEGSNEAFEETINNLVGYNHLQTYLKFDYSDYINEVEKAMYQDLLKAEYILSQRANPDNGGSTSYFTSKEVRKVQYFKYTPVNSSEANKLAEMFQAIVDGKATTEDLKALVTKEGGIEEAWKLQQLDELAKDFAMINDKAGLVNTNAKYPLPAAYAAKVAEFETKWANDTEYGYRDIYQHKADYDATEISEAKAKLTDYSANGTQSIFDGYYDKQLAIITQVGLVEEISTTDTSSIISSDVNKKIKDFKVCGNTNFIDVYETGTAVFKSGSDYYLLWAEKITDSSELALKKEAAAKLATVTSNVKNCTYFYLTDLTEKGLFEVNNQDIYDYLNENYNYGETD